MFSALSPGRREKKSSCKYTADRELLISNCRLRQGLAQRGVLMTACHGPTASASPGWIAHSTFIYIQNTALRSVSPLRGGHRGRGLWPRLMS